MQRDAILGLSPYVEVAVRNMYWRAPWLGNASARLASILARDQGSRTSIGSASISSALAVLGTWGVERGDVLLVHSSYRALRLDGESPDEIVGMLLDMVGREGTLVMPAIPRWADAPQGHDRITQDVSDLVLSFDPASTPAWTGALPNAMLRHPEAIRSLHPLNNVVAIGARASEMMKDTLGGDRPTPNGPGSPWEFMYGQNAKVVALGADLAHSLTMIHLAEDLQPDDWPVRDWYRDRTFRILIDGQWQCHVVRERHPKWAMYYGERTLSKDLPARE